MDVNGLHQIIGYLREDFKAFKNNDFKHLREKVEGQGRTTFWLFITLIGGLLSIVGGLVLLIVRQFS